MATPELYDQEGYLIRIGVGGALRIDGKLVRSQHVSVVVNDDIWKGVQYIDARANELNLDELGRPTSIVLPDSAHGHVEILSEREHDGEPIVEPARRIMALHGDTTLAIVVHDPDDPSRELRRITCYGCHFDPPAAHPTDRGSRLQVTASFKANRYEDA